MRSLLFLLLGGTCFFFIEAKKEQLVLVDDMIMTLEQKEFYDQLVNGRARRDAIKDSWLWPGGVVRYSFHNNLGEKGKKLAKDAMKEWEEKTCLKFEEVSGKKLKKKNYAEFKFDGDCRARIGYAREKAQLISIGSKKEPCPLGSAIHEIGHTVAFFHEQARPDRDKYIKVIWKNMRKGKWVKQQFKKVDPKFVDYRGHKYDYKSIMHYSPLQGAKDANSPVLKPKKKGVKLKKMKHLSEGDIAQIKDMYKCNDKNDSEFSKEDIPPPREDEDDKTEGPRPGDFEE